MFGESQYLISQYLIASYLRLDYFEDFGFSWLYSCLLFDDRHRKFLQH